MMFQLQLNWSLASLGGYSTSSVALLVIRVKEVFWFFSSKLLKPMDRFLPLVSTALKTHKPVELSTEVVLGGAEEQLLVPGAGQGLLSWREVRLDEFLASQALEQLLHTEDYLSILPKSS